MVDRIVPETPTYRTTFFGSGDNNFSSSYSEAMDRSRSAVENAMRTINNEAFQFIGKRLAHTGQAIEDCQGCKTVEDFFAVHHKWAAEAVREYFDESVRLGQTMQSLLSDFTGLQSAFRTKNSL